MHLHVYYLLAVLEGRLVRGLVLMVEYNYECTSFPLTIFASKALTQQKSAKQLGKNPQSFLIPTDLVFLCTCL